MELLINVLTQTSVLESLQWTVRPHCSVPYALDEPTEQANLTVTAPGGVTLSYDLNILGENRGLTYENFIYIAFTGTFTFFFGIQLNKFSRATKSCGNRNNWIVVFDVATREITTNFKLKISYFPF